MNEENNNINQDAADAQENVQETVQENVQEAVQEIVPDAAEEGIFVFEPGSDAGTNKNTPKAVNSKLLPVMIAAGAVIVAIIVAVVLKMNWSTWFNKYNRMGYVDVSGRTIAQVADASGKDLKDFLEEFGLPADMPANTTESAAYYMIPVSKIAASYGMDFETLKEYLKWDDSITEDTTWGEAEGETTLGTYVGEENLEEFKEQFGLDDSVNADTKWKEVRTAVDTKNKEDNEKAKQEAESGADQTADIQESDDQEANTEETAETAETTESDAAAE